MIDFIIALLFFYKGMDNMVDFTKPMEIINAIKQLSTSDVDKLVVIAANNELTSDPDGLRKSLMDIRGESSDPNAQRI